jgi:hypothetical protein
MYTALSRRAKPMEIISRTEARNKGLPRYFTGKACPHGHIAERTVGGKHCVECNKVGSEKYRNAYPQRKLEREKAYKTGRRASDINYKLSRNIRTKLYHFIRGKTKNHPHVGCSREFFLNYISSKFTEGMTWDNYGVYWQIDHIHPLSRFDLTDITQLSTVCHYSNIQPLTNIENLKKGAS